MEAVGTGSDPSRDGVWLQIMYGIGGERDLTERTLEHLSGYDGARPVRAGNGAWDQHQNDVCGDADAPPTRSTTTPARVPHR